MVVELTDKGMVCPNGFRRRRQEIGPSRAIDGRGVKLVDQVQDE